MNKTYSLVSVKNTWELTYKEDTKSSGMGEKAIMGIVSVIAAPIISVVGTLILINSISRWSKSYQTGVKAANLVQHLSTADVDLQAEAESRIRHCDKRINKIKNEIKRVLGREFWDSAKLDIGVPQKKYFYDYLSKDIPDSYWNDFSWDDFLKKDFLESKTSEFDKGKLFYIDKLRIRLAAAIKQTEALKSDPTILRDVYEFKSLKNSIKIEDSKKWIRYGLFCLIPTGLFWGIYLYPTDDKKWFGSKEKCIQDHNKFIKKPYLSPYLTHIASDC